MEEKISPCMQKHDHQGYQIPHERTLWHGYFEQHHQPNYSQKTSHCKGMARTPFRKKSMQWYPHYHVRNKEEIVKAPSTVYTARGIDMGRKKIYWGCMSARTGAPSSGSPSWTTLKVREEKTSWFLVDRLTGFPQAVKAVYPQTEYSTTSSTRSGTPRNSSLTKLSKTDSRPKTCICYPDRGDSPKWTGAILRQMGCQTTQNL